MEVPLALLSEWERPGSVMQAGLGALFLGIALGYVLGRRERID